MAWRPLADRVLVKVDDVNMTPGGIILPDEAKRKPQRGRVVAVGPGAPRQMSAVDEVWPMDTRVGDEVLFARYAGADLGDIEELKGYVLMSERDIIAVWHD